MNFRDFLQKWSFDPSTNEQVNAMDVGGWLSAMDYLFCTKTKEQVLEMVGEFYDNADEIYNTLNEAANETISQMREDGIIDADGNLVDDEDDNSHNA
jgi:hypothetical protein